MLLSSMLEIVFIMTFPFFLYDIFTLEIKWCILTLISLYFFVCLSLIVLYTFLVNVYLNVAVLLFSSVDMWILCRLHATNNVDDH